MNQPSDYLYLEAANLGGVIDDTEDLSTRRAGGYMLLELVRKVESACAAWLSPVSVGASQGLFELNPGQSMADARQAVMAVLAQPLYAQATVLVADTVADPGSKSIANGDFSAKREHLYAVIRRRQLNTLGCVTEFGGPPTVTAADKQEFKQVCEVDGVRPAIERKPLKTAENRRWHSQSVARRREDGVRLRQDFYRRELATPLHQLEFTDHFDELSSFGEGESGTLRPTLEHKIAVFYVDGDGFGSLARACKTAELLTAWDRLVQSQRRKFLAALVELLENHPHGCKRICQGDVAKTARLRVETLMWGGDELLLVLPAWLGFEVAQLFFDTCKIEWPACSCNVARPDCGCTPIHRSHSAALVFAHHNAPISQLQKLSKTLAEEGKRDGSLCKKKDSLHWITLESFDHAGTALHDDGRAWWLQRGLPTLSWDAMALDPARIGALLSNLPEVAGALPRRNLYRLIDLLPRWDSAGCGEKRLGRLAYDNLHAATVKRQHRDAWRLCWQALQAGLDLDWPDLPGLPEEFAKPEHLNAWLMLAELWDYLLPRLASPVPAPDQKEATADTPTSTQEAA